MKKQAFRIFATLSLLAIMGLSSVYGQIVHALKFNAPFDFIVGKTTLPAGEYTVELDRIGLAADTGSRLLIRSADDRLCAAVMTMPVQALAIQAKAKLVFNRYGDQYFLSQVWTPGDNVGRELPQSHVERELAKSASKVEKAAVAARRK